MSGKEIRVENVIDTNDGGEEVKQTEKQSVSNGQVPDKYIKNLTDEDRAIIVKNYADGIQNDNYDVKILRGGSVSITRKRGGKPKSIDEELIKEAGKTHGKVGNMTTEQFMIERFLNLEGKFSKLKNKQKRLKKKYRKIKGDIYVNDEEVGDVIEVKVTEHDVKDDEIIEKKPDIKSEPVVEQVQPMKNDENQRIERPQYRNVGRKMNLRERLLLQRGMLQV